MSPEHLLCLAASGLSLALLTYPLAVLPACAPPRLGALGLARRRALRRSVLRRALDPALRWAAACVEGLRLHTPLGRLLGPLHARQAQHLVRAGHYLGLTADEYSAICLGGALAGGVLAAWLESAGASGRWSWLLPLLGAGAFVLQVDEARAERQKQIRRGLPTAIDLAALCMTSGLDFPGALRLLVSHGEPDDPVREELGYLLASLELGHTRRSALEQLERRVPIADVQRFARALIQAEEKGSPIVEALAAQAKLSRLERSVRIEESAARAAALLVLPMLLLLCTIFVLLMGPFFAGGLGL